MRNRKEYYKAYYQAHKEQHKESVKARNKAYYQSHKEEKNAYKKADLNSLGQTKNYIRLKSSRVLKRMNLHI